MNEPALDIEPGPCMCLKCKATVLHVVIHLAFRPLMDVLAKTKQPDAESEQEKHARLVALGNRFSERCLREMNRYALN